MANIDTYLQQIMAAIYGEEVRGSIHDAIEAINDQVDAAEETMEQFVQGAMDTTLTSTTKPAQGKAVGDSINGLNHFLNNEIKNRDYLLNIQYGFINNLFNGKYQNRFIKAQTGEAETTDNLRYLSSVDYVPVNPGYVYIKTIPNKTSSTSMWFYFYNSNHIFLSYYNINATNLSDNNIITAPSNATYLKFMIDYGSGNTVPVQNVDKIVTITGSDLFNNIMNYKRKISSGSLNDILEPGSYNIGTNDVNNITDLPVQEGGTLLVAIGFGGGVHHCLQLYFTAGYKMFFRFVLDTGVPFGTWNIVNVNFSDSNYIKRILVTSSTASSEFEGLANNFPINSEIACSNSWFSDMADLPAGWYFVKTVPTSQNTGNLSQRLQIAFSGLGTNGLSVPENKMIFVRFIVSSEIQSDWINIYKTNDNIKYIAFGDSVCRGNHPDASKSQFSWPEAFGRAKKISCQNAAIGGQGYLTTQYTVKAIDTIQSTDITNANLITLAYGINDASNQGLPIGTADDTSGNTILGAAYQCVSHIYSQNKKVQLVICGTTKQNGTWSSRLAEINAGLKALAGKYGIAFLDMSESPINIFNGLTGGELTSDGTHFNDYGYKLLSQYMIAKLGSFFDV